MIIEPIMTAKIKTTWITGKIPVLTNHLISCDYCPDNIREDARESKLGTGKVPKSSETEHDGSLVGIPSRIIEHSSNEDKSNKRQKTFTVIAKKPSTLPPVQQVDF